MQDYWSHEDLSDRRSKVGGVSREPDALNTSPSSLVVLRRTRRRSLRPNNFLSVGLHSCNRGEND